MGFALGEARLSRPTYAGANMGDPSSSSTDFGWFGSSYGARYQHDQQDEQNHAHGSARPVAPATAVRPSRKNGDQQEHEKDNYSIGPCHHGAIRPSWTKGPRTIRSVDERPCTIEYIKEHTAGEPAGIGVLQRGMKAGNQVAAPRKGKLRTVGELEAWLALGLVSALQVLQITVKGNAPETNHHPQMSQQRNLLIEIRRTVREFRALGRIVGRRAPDHGADPAIVESHAVIPSHGIGLRSEAGVVKNGIQKISGAVSGKRTASAIRAVRTRSQSQYQHASLFVAKRGNRFSPVNPILIGTPLAGGDGFAVFAQTAATLTADDTLVEKCEWARIRGNRARTGRRQTGTSRRRSGVCSGEGAHTRL
jgi:hypothetical protein